VVGHPDDMKGDIAKAHMVLKPSVNADVESCQGTAYHRIGNPYSL
jgi:hypothetical protein